MDIFKNQSIRCLIMALLTVSVLSCQEVGGLSINTQGPDVEFDMTYDAQQATQTQGNFVLFAKSDTVQPINIEDYLLEVGQTHNAVVEKAQWKNSFLKTFDDSTLTHIKSIRIEVKSLEEENSSVLFEQTITEPNNLIELNKCNMSACEIFSLIENGYVAYLYVEENQPYKLKDSTVFQFVSGTVIGIKVKGGALLNLDF